MLYPDSAVQWVLDRISEPVPAETSRATQPQLLFLCGQENVATRKISVTECFRLCSEGSVAERYIVDRSAIAVYLAARDKRDCPADSYASGTTCTNRDWTECVSRARGEATAWLCDDLPTSLSPDKGWSGAPMAPCTSSRRRPRSRRRKAILTSPGAAIAFDW